MLNGLNILYNKKLLVAFSGGKDSLVLLHYLHVHQRNGGWEVVACHVNHNLRGEESQRDELFCKNWCHDKNISFVALSVNIDRAPRGVEHAAREARYRLLEAERARSGCDFIVTAHTADDQLESFFVDLLTGASIYTLGGVSAQNGRVVRPMLNTTTEMILEYLDKNGLECVYDSSNGAMNYKRNLVRSKIIPFMREYGEIPETVFRLQRESALLNRAMSARTEGVATFDGEMVLIDRARFERLAEHEQHFLLGKWLSISCRGGVVHCDAILEQLGRDRSARLALPERHFGEITPRAIRIFPRAMVAPFRIIKPVGVESVMLPNGRVIAFDEELVAKELVVRSRVDGDRLNGKKLKDLFNDMKMDLFDRDRAAVVEYDGAVIGINSPSPAKGN